MTIRFRSRLPIPGPREQLALQAVYQLRHAVVAKAIDGIVNQIDQLLGSPTPLFVIVPIIVTTAELWRLTSGTTVEDVRNAQEIQDVASAHDIVVLRHQPDNLDRQQVIDRFYASLDQTQTAKFDGLLKSTTGRSFSFFVDYFASYNPSLFVIIRYERFRSAMVNLHKFFGQESLVTHRGAG